MQLIFDTKGIKVDRRRNLFYIEAPDGTERSISPRKVTSIAITQSCWLSASAVELAVAYEIPILFFSFTGKALARLNSPYFSSIATLRRQQALFPDTLAATDWIIGLYLLKLEHQIENIRKIQPKAPDIQLMRAQMPKLEAISGSPLVQAAQRIRVTEAIVARYYWQALATLLPQKYDFEKRSKQPAQDNFNAALNYFYGMLYSVVESGIFAAGLDPHLGLLHADEYNKPVLSYDLIEPFRPWVDWLLISQYRENRVRAAFFNHTKAGVLLNKEGKAWLIPCFNEWLRSERLWGGHKTSVKNHIYHLAGRLAKKLRET